ncbi:DUF4010 domain-containing protein [Flavobacterium sp. NRK F10]|uniref:DUF4010 domain-containing protein n=1 Tax=Flavobacterium sediminis TaxID=2201181 RepID=A0A2U8QS58_9FLAO|nr:MULTISPECIES: DUF4010 domain-containing protein [Flavobacterium]AWM12997.1 hypothetical protein DI487_03360 [Flavobacterium sediminis]MCO6174146.1 DUF4010 domain-containing protein [Flavobacterium sp. NRK F10]
MEVENWIPQTLIEFVLVVLFSLSIGLEQRKRFPKEKQTFGTDRTFAFIGVLGFLLLLADKETLIPFLVGFVMVGVFLAIYYFQKIKIEGRYGLTTVILGLITYSFSLILLKNPHWFSLLFFVAVIILAQIKKPLQDFSDEIDSEEFITLAKFIIITGVVLPLLPKETGLDWLPVSPYNIWLAVVVVSAISYLSYLLRKYAFPKAGLLLTGILGGLYSSTASTIILAKKSKETGRQPKTYAATIVMATAMMFLRIYILIVIFNVALALKALPYFIVLFGVTLTVGFWMYRSGKDEVSASQPILDDRNPLEFKVAVVFSLLYVLFSAITQFSITHFGQQGLNGLSIIVGFTDIDPFLLNLFQGHYDVTSHALLAATLQAIVGNNIIKLGYAWFLSGEGTKKWVLKGFGVVLLFNIAAILLLYTY